MNKIQALLLCLASTLLVHGQSIKVRLADAKCDSVKVTLIRTDLKGTEKEEMIALKKKSFVYSIENERKARVVVFSYNNGTRHDVVLDGTIVPGENGKLTVKNGKESWKGTAFYKELQTVMSKTAPLRAEQKRIVAEINKGTDAGKKRPDSMKPYMDKLSELGGRISLLNKDYINRHPGSDVSALLLWDIEKATQETIDRLGHGVKTGRMSNFVEAMQDVLDKERDAALREMHAKATQAPDFTLKDIDGKDLTLSDMRGKYVVLDFWGSWCGWCIKGMPDMKEAYGKYKDKMEIVGVDCNDREDVWKKTVDELQLPWRHVYNPKDSGVLKSYKVRGFPTKVVIDPAGMIVKTVVGESPEFYQFLDKLFSK